MARGLRRKVEKWHKFCEQKTWNLQRKRNRSYSTWSIGVIAQNMRKIVLDWRVWVGYTTLILVLLGLLAFLELVLMKIHLRNRPILHVFVASHQVGFLGFPVRFVYSSTAEACNCCRKSRIKKDIKSRIIWFLTLARSSSLRSSNLTFK